MLNEFYFIIHHSLFNVQYSKAPQMRGFLLYYTYLLLLCIGTGTFFYFLLKVKDEFTCFFIKIRDQ